MCQSRGILTMERVKTELVVLVSCFPYHCVFDLGFHAPKASAPINDVPIKEET